MIEIYKKVVFENYANFKGRARASEYWKFLLCNIIIAFSLIVAGAIIGAIFGNPGAGAGTGYLIYVLYSFFVFIPSLAVLVRRLHDTGKSGAYFFFVFIPIVGPILLLIAVCTAGDYGSNKYGADPKNEFDEMSQIGKE